MAIEPEKGDKPSTTEERLEREYLFGQLQRSRGILRTLQQSLAPGENDIQLWNQILYQRKFTNHIEDRFRGLPSNRGRIIQSMNRIAEAAHGSGVDLRTSDYLKSLACIAEEEFQRDRTDHDIVSAAIGAAVIVAERLGEEIVKPALRRELDSFAPGGVIRGM